MHPNDLSNERSWHLGNKAVGLMHVCKCTCFTTNTTLIPLYVPQRPGDLCSTCTKQFCVERAEGCRGAQIAEGNDDTGTGFEGQVWAKCFSTYTRSHSPRSDQGPDDRAAVLDRRAGALARGIPAQPRGACNACTSAARLALVV